MKKLAVRKYATLTVLLVCFVAQRVVLGAANKSESKRSSSDRAQNIIKRITTNLLFSPVQSNIDDSKLTILKANVLELGWCAQFQDKKPIAVGNIICYLNEIESKKTTTVVEKRPNTTTITVTIEFKKGTNNNPLQQIKKFNNALFYINQLEELSILTLTLPTEGFTKYSRKKDHTLVDKLEDDFSKK